MTNRNRFELALKNIKSSDWFEFENLCSTFLVSEFPSFRTMASKNGDKGRDGEIFTLDAKPKIAFQFSVSENWKTKIENTVKTLNMNFPEVSYLRYLTNQEIGANADSIKSKFLDKGLILDVCDINWFLDRFHLDPNRNQAAEQICQRIADPLLRVEDNFHFYATDLDDKQIQTALFYIDMQKEDDALEKNITRSCFEALVKAALSEATKEKPLLRGELYERVQGFLPRYEIAHIKRFIDKAIIRLKKKSINEFKDSDSFCLNYQAIKDIKDKKSKRIVRSKEYISEICELLSSKSDMDDYQVEKASIVVIRSINEYFLRKGEVFAAAIVRGEAEYHDSRTLDEAVTKHISSHDKSITALFEIVKAVAAHILTAPSEAAGAHLRSLSDAYTLMAFLSETPDVQDVTNKLFRQGTIWLDTSVILPLFAEFTEPSNRPFSSLFERARKAGAKFKITPGVVEEIERHFNRCQTYATNNNWSGSVPYIYQRYALQGGEKFKYKGWQEKFLGQNQPQRDIQEFLFRYGIEMVDPIDTSKLDHKIINSITEYWRRVHHRRRGDADFVMQANRLAIHDSENALNVIAERKNDVGHSGIGFRSWWLTLDGAAYRMKDDDEIRSADRNFYSPVMSIDFLFKYLAYGPARHIAHESPNDIQRIFADDIIDIIPEDLMAVAHSVRVNCTGLPDYIVRRRIRDALDRARLTVGGTSLNTLEDIDRSIDGLF